MQIDKKILENLRFYSDDEKKAFLKMIPILRNEPSVSVALAIFRDSLVFHSMAHSMILNMSLKIQELEARIAKLEENKSDEELLEDPHEDQGDWKKGKR